MTEKKLIQEAVEYNEKVKNTMMNVMDDYDPCDFEDFMEYTESMIDYTLGRLGFDPYDEETEEDYNHLSEILLNNYGDFLISTYENSCE